MSSYNNMVYPRALGYHPHAKPLSKPGAGDFIPLGNYSSPVNHYNNNYQRGGRRSFQKQHYNRSYVNYAPKRDDVQRLSWNRNKQSHKPSTVAETYSQTLKMVFENPWEALETTHNAQMDVEMESTGNAQEIKKK